MSLCGYYEKSGKIYLGHGLHEILIKIDGNPCKISFVIEDPADGCCVCCCNGLNKINLHILKNGFKLYADIKTNTACINWNCTYKE